MPAIRFYNTLTHRAEPFTPVEPGKVFMYNCGPTVYDFAHIGNFKTFLFADVLRRFLELVGYEVHQVMNITDVGHMTDDQLADGGGEDKMQLAAKRLAEAKKAGKAHVAAIDDPSDPYQIAAFYTQAFLDDAKKLGLKVADEFPANMPRATQFVESHMIPMIGRLIDNGHAYVAEEGSGGGAVYYAVETFEGYGKLSGNTIDQLKGGAGGRVTTQAGKRHPADFLLWKPDASHLMKWNSPWGEGYPGWHIECSAMARAVLGREVIDIHTGGEDNIFPHHECEIAQSVGSTDPSVLEACGNFRGFARFWMHSRHLMVEGQKMSKSKGNFYTVRDVLEGKVTGRPVDPAVMRFAMIRGHYRSNLDFSAKSLEESGSAVQKLREAYRTSERGWFEDSHPVVREFVEAVSDDLNIAAGLGILFSWLKSGFDNTSKSSGALRSINRVLGVLPSSDSYVGVGSVGIASTGFDLPAHTGEADDSIRGRCRALDAARAAKDFAAADAIRDELIAAGYDVKTTKQGTVATKKLA